MFTIIFIMMMMMMSMMMTMSSFPPTKEASRLLMRFPTMKGSMMMIMTNIEEMCDGGTVLDSS